MGKQRGKFTIAMVAVVAIPLVSGLASVFAHKQASAPSMQGAIVANDYVRQADTGASVAKSTPGNLVGSLATQTRATQPLADAPGITFVMRGDKMIANDANGWLATFTNGARTVALRGALRTFSEPGVASTITHNVWVRLLPAPFSGGVDELWLRSVLDDASLDVLGVAMQYVAGSPTLRDDAGRVYASDADFGPLNPDGTRQEGSDFNDYLSIAHAYDGAADVPEPAQIGAMDCSGYMRMVWGRRNGVALTNQPDAGSRALPRRAVQMYASGPGVVVIPQGVNTQAGFAELQPGDMVFFDASMDDGAAIDHVGIYLGVDPAGNNRFISSRKTANGPTLGDVGGRSVFNGTGLYATSFVAARRL